MMFWEGFYCGAATVLIVLAILAPGRPTRKARKCLRHVVRALVALFMRMSSG